MAGKNKIEGSALGIEERVHDDAIEHRHPGFDYWHPQTRVHPGEEKVDEVIDLGDEKIVIGTLPWSGRNDWSYCTTLDGSHGTIVIKQPSGSDYARDQRGISDITQEEARRIYASHVGKPTGRSLHRGLPVYVISEKELGRKF